MKLFKKILKWIGISFGTLIGLFLCVIFILSLCRPIIFSKYEKNSKAICDIPGLNQNYTPQGVCYNKDKKVYLFCGYMNNKTNSKIFVANEQGELIKEVNLLKEDNSLYKGHAGGIASLNDDVYLSNASKIFHLKLSDILACENKGEISFDGSFKVNSRASYCYINDNYLFVGEYSDRSVSSYKTDASHHFTDDKTNYAICSLYKVDQSKEYHIDYSSPEMVLSLPDYVQGICQVDDKTICLSRSHGINFSSLDFYDLSKASKVGEFETKDVYFLGKNCLNESVRVPPMSEDIDFVDGKILINFESGCRKYRLVNIWKSEKLMAYTI